MKRDQPIPAATLILLRDAPAFEALMIARGKDMAFAGGALVFPGGRVDPGDGDPLWAEYARGLDPACAAAQVAAVREAFEETGVLLAREAGGDAYVEGGRVAALDFWREKIASGDATFLDMIGAERLELACDRLRLFAHWIAPPGLHRRFDTLFFAAPCPERQSARADGVESIEALWIAPADAVAARASGARKMIFPTARNVELLALSRSWADVVEQARRRTIAPIMPALVERGGVAYLAIPDGYGYPVTEERLELSVRV